MNKTYIGIDPGSAGRTYTIPEPPEGMINNPDKKIYDLIVKGLIKLDGQCPCVPKYLQNNNTICPCKSAREKQICRCGMFVPVDVHG